MKKIVTLLVSMIGALFLFTSVASAHVTIGPKETSQGAYEMFTVKVPSEKEDASTAKIQVLIPEDVNITRFEPKPGWKYEIQKDDSDKITTVTWTTEGEGLSATEFGQFNMNGKVGDKATEIVWKAIQTYSDGSVVEWVEAQEANYPASITVVNPADSSAHGHGEKTSDKAASSEEKATEEVKETSVSASNTPLYLSIVAIIAGLIALVISLKKRG
ncbi:YcnI family protein [Neobacillus drentensis]|uniref:YcnI family copper-binding membrane protein n=1 Tax=Neobacillus drentensis TaxID=220684 RepID=UPI003000757B